VPIIINDRELVDLLTPYNCGRKLILSKVLVKRRADDDDQSDNVPHSSQKIDIQFPPLPVQIVSPDIHTVAEGA
jgi:hypothetical protein